MNFAKRTLMVVGVVALAVLIVAVLAPNTAHGLVAALVQVTNTTANPVPTASTDAQSGFVASNYCYFNSSWPQDQCALDPLYSVPAGKIAVLESASGACVTSSAKGMREFQLQFTDPAGNYGQLGFPPTNVATPGSDTMNTGAVGTTAQNFKFYASAGSSIKFYGYAAENQSGGMFCRFTVSGHLAPTP